MYCNPTLSFLPTQGDWKLILYQNWDQVDFSFSAFDSPIVVAWHNEVKGGWPSQMKYRWWKSGVGNGWRAERDTSEVLRVTEKKTREGSIILERGNEERTFSKCNQSFIFVCQTHFLLQLMPVGLMWGHDPRALPFSRSFISPLSQKLLLVVSLSPLFLPFPLISSLLSRHNSLEQT